MAEVRLYIYNDSSKKGEGILFNGIGTYTYEIKTLISDVTESDSSIGGTIRTVKTNIVSYSIPLTLTKLDYNKKVYNPCEIYAELQMGMTITKKEIIETKITQTDQDGKSSDTKQERKETSSESIDKSLADIVKFFKGAKVTLKIDEHTVADNYLIFKVRSLYKTVSSRTTIFLELNIFSADKLMDLDKYSRAYTGKKLYYDILLQESSKFDLVHVNNHIQLLKYKKEESLDGNNYNVTARDELRIPYVVQYNESFYHFMARTANRFGEFLYFEDGKLNLGMQPSEKNYYKKDSDNKDVVINWATEPDAVQSLYFDSEITEGIPVKERAYDFTSHTPNSDTAFADSTDSRYNFDPVSTDEWTNMSLKKNEYLEVNEILGEEMKAYIPEFIFKALEMTTLGEALVVLLKEVAGKVYEVWNSVADYNNVLDDSNYNSVKNDDQKSDDHFTEFATYAGSTHLNENLKALDNTSDIMNYTSYFYPLIRRKEKEIDEQKVFLDFGNYYKPINLGDRLYVSGKDYIAISIEGTYEIEEKGGDKTIKEHLLVSAVPVMKLDETKASQESTPAGWDAWTNVLPFPPLLSDVIIRDARPQVAFVAENLDPQNLGRIRVRYPWQDETGDASPWIRVTLPLATAGGAVNFTPSIGDEVMVGYEHGNIDRPYAMGYLTAPFVNKRWSNAIPLDQYGGVHGIKTKTGHHLTFSDGYAFAPLIANTLGPLAFVKSLWPVGKTGVVDWPYANETTQDFGGGFELSDRYGFYKIKGSTDERSVTIESPAGTVEVNAFQGITINAPNGDIAINGKNVSISASNKLSLSSGENIKNKLWYQKNWGLKDDGFIGSSLKDLAGSVKEETWGQFIDMSFVRCVLEYFLHPVNGTLQIKSYTFVSIEAGEGVTEIPRASLRYGKGKTDEQLNSFEIAAVTTSLIKTNVLSLINEIKPKYEALCSATEKFVFITKNTYFNYTKSHISYDTVIKKGTDQFTVADTDFKWDNDPVNGNDLAEYKGTFDKNGGPKVDDDKYKNNHSLYIQDFIAFSSSYLTHKDNLKKNTLRERKRNVIVDVCNQLRCAAYELSVAAKKWKEMKDTNFVHNGTQKEKVDVSAAVEQVKGLKISKAKGFVSIDDMVDFSYNDSISMPKEGAWKNLEVGMSRYAIYKYLLSKDYIKQDKIINSVDDAIDNKKWVKYANSIENNKVLNALSFVNEHFNPFCGFIDDQLQWSHGFKGKILMSDQENKTVSFDDNLTLISHNNHAFYEESINGLRKLVKSL